MTTLASPVDLSAVGSLAQATLCAPDGQSAHPREAPDFTRAAPHAFPCPFANRKGWRRVVDVLLSPISGPTLERLS